MTERAKTTPSISIRLSQSPRGKGIIMLCSLSRHCCVMPKRCYLMWHWLGRHQNRQGLERVSTAGPGYSGLRFFWLCHCLASSPPPPPLSSSCLGMASGPELPAHPFTTKQCSECLPHKPRSELHYSFWLDERV
jgi:hypothetical protein